MFCCIVGGNLTHDKLNGETRLLKIFRLERACLFFIDLSRALSSLMALPSLVVFGPQTIWPSDQYLYHLRAVLLLNPRLRPFILAIRELPSLWESLTVFDARLVAVPGLRLITDLHRWLDYGTISQPSEEFPNALLTPFTVIIHITQYFQYLDSTDGGLTHSDIFKRIDFGGFQGFCTGILAAIAASCSKNDEDLSTLGVVALRLALCIGAYMDLDLAYADQSTKYRSLAVRWKLDAGSDTITDILGHYPEVSAPYNRSRASKSANLIFDTYSGIHICR